jgi:O-antigen/teichoic acid export membrane protein
VAGMLPFAAMTSGAAQEIAVCVFGEAFRPAAIPLSILIFGSVGFVTISVVTAILTAAGRPRWTVALTAPLVLASIAGNLYLIPLLGGFGAALVTTSVGAIGALASVVTVQRFWGVSIPTATLVRTLLISAGAYALAAFWPVSGLLFLTLKLCVISALILLGFFALREFTPLELSAMRAFFRRQVAQAQNPSSL